MAKKHDVPSSTVTTLARRDEDNNVTSIAVGLPQNSDEPIALRESTFLAAGTQRVTTKQANILQRPSDPVKEIDVTPDGKVYMAQIHVRRRLNEAFGPMGWALRPLTLENVEAAPGQMFQRFALVGEGRVIATAMGSAKYYPKRRDGSANTAMDYADVSESVKSNALTRCSKDLGIGSECWDRRWANDWLDDFGVRVMTMEKRNDTQSSPKAVWRRIDSKPFPGEFAIADDSPNHAIWREQHRRYIELWKAEIAESRKLAEDLKATRVTLQKARDYIASFREQKAKDLGIETERPAERAKPEMQKEHGSRAAQPEQPREPVKHAPRTVRTDLRPFTIRECRIVSGKDKRQFHKIVMMNGAEYFTFSTTVYAEMQKMFASRTPVVIQAEAKKTTKGTFNHVVEWQLYKPEAES